MRNPTDPPGADGCPDGLPAVIFFVGCLVCLSCGQPGRDTEPVFRQMATEIDELVQAYEALGRFSGAVAVGVDSELLFAHGYALADRETAIGNTPETRFDLGSLTKQFTAAAILKLEAAGRLRVEDSISTHLPDYPRPQSDRVTLHHLLSHTSGIPSLWRLGDGLEDVEATPDPISLDSLLGFFQSRELLFEPGERFQYSNSGYVVLAAIIEKVSEKPYEDYLQEALFRPLGMNDTGCKSATDEAKPYHGHSPDIELAPSEHPSWSVGDGCVRSTVLDLLKWDAALRDERFLPAAQREKLFAPHTELRPGVAYGYGWFLSEMHGRPVAHHSGASAGVISEMYRFPHERLSVLVLANYAPELGINAPAAIIDQVTAIYFRLPVEPLPAVIELSREELAHLAGRYSMDSGGTFEVEADGGRLWIEGVGGTRSVFDFGMLEEPAVFERGVESARKALSAGLADDFGQIPICETLREELAPGELRDDWRSALRGRGALLEMTPARADRYPGEDTLIVVSRLLFEQGETFFSLDLTPALEICGWYHMDRAEFDVRSSFSRPRRVPLVPVGPTEFLADGFNYREQDVWLALRSADQGARVELALKGAVEHSGRRVETPRTE